MIRKIIHNKLYHHIQVLLKDSEFIKDVNDIKKDFIELGCGLPPDGLKNESDFDSWVKRYWECRDKTKLRPEIFNEKIRKIELEN